MTDDTLLLLEAFAMEAGDQIAHMESGLLDEAQPPSAEGWSAAADCFRLLAAAAEMMELSAVQMLAQHGLTAARTLAEVGDSSPLALASFQEGVAAFRELLASLTQPSVDADAVLETGMAAFTTAVRGEDPHVPVDLPVSSPAVTVAQAGRTPLGEQPTPALMERLARWRRGAARHETEEYDPLLRNGLLAVQALMEESSRPALLVWKKPRPAATPVPEPLGAPAPAGAESDLSAEAPEPAKEETALPGVAPELLKIFAEEVDEHLAALAENLTVLWEDAHDAAALREVRRSLHTLKGAAGMVGLAELHRLNWVAEETIEERIDAGLTASPALLDLIEATTVALAEARGAEFAPESMTACAALEPRWRAVNRELHDQADLPGAEPPEAAVEERPLTADEDLAAEPAAATIAEDQRAEPAPVAETVLGDVAPWPEVTMTAPASRVAGAAEQGGRPAAGADGELAAIFAAEAESGLQVMSEVLTLLAEQAVGGDESPETVAGRQASLLELQRQLHTLKGAAAMMQQQVFATLAHQMEDVVEQLSGGGLPMTRAVVGLLFETAGALETLARGGELKPAALQELTTRYRAVQGAAGAVRSTAELAETPAALPTGGTTLRVDLRQLDQLMEFAGELITNRAGFEERLTGLSGLLRDFERSVERLARVSRALEYDYEAWGVAGEQPAGGADEFDTLEFDRYTEFHRLAGELAEAVADVRTISREVASGLGGMTMLVARQRRVTTALREGIETVRLVPLAGLSTLTRRIVRQAALAEGKEVAIEASGLEAQVDRTIYETLTTALNHLLRNAVVHGIEAPAARLAAGKPEQGRVTVDVRQEHYETVVTIADDGGGIDRVAVRRAAEAQGWLAPEEGIDDRDLLRLIFRPRLSTSENVDESAGRGVGLDAVLAAVNGARGRIEVESTPGVGTTFTLRLPLVMVVGNVLLVECSGRRVALPMRWLDRTLRVEATAVRAGSAGPETMVDGEWLPVVALAELLGWPAQPGEQTSWPAVVARAGDRRAVVLTDALVQRQELAIATLGPSFGWLRAIQGATVLGSGQVAPVLDLAALLEQGRAVVEEVAAATRPVRVLVVDDSLSVRRVVTMALERQGWEVVAARHGIEALELLASEPVDIALLDVEMPQMDGYTLLERLRSSGRYASLPVAMLTSRSADKHRQRAMQLGAQAYLVKPYQEEDLVATLRYLLERRDGPTLAAEAALSA